MTKTSTGNGSGVTSWRRKFAKDMNVFGRGPEEGAFVTEMDVRCTYVAMMTIVVTAIVFSTLWMTNPENQWVFSFKTTEAHWRLNEGGSSYYDDLYTLVEIGAQTAAFSGVSQEITATYDYTVNYNSDEYISCNKV